MVHEIPTGRPFGGFPRVRMRRNRAHAWSRRLVQENELSTADLIWPIFLQEQAGRTPIGSMPGVDRLGPDVLVDAVGHAAELGIPAIALFPHVPDERKTPLCEEAWNEDNLVCRSLRAIRAAGLPIGTICDVALDPYNSAGHDGIVRDGVIVNDETVEALQRQAVAQANSGGDVQAPSDMMDGRIGALRDALDAAGHQGQLILSYAVKYASSFYGPFRDAVGSGGALKGDKKTYQMDPANSDEALREAALDLQEGADLLMVKPGMPYLDVLARVRRELGAPTFAYQVSGEFAMIRAAAANGWIDGDKVMLESLLAFRRAGADAVLTYFAPEAAARIRAG
ncbi:MAG: porphobilinogen synthase [Planctomycetes bacterium]|nr:porphobilinogen synthase [Planctomycetota bacterium]